MWITARGLARSWCCLLTYLSTAPAPAAQGHLQRGTRIARAAFLYSYTGGLYLPILESPHHNAMDTNALPLSIFVSRPHDILELPPYSSSPPSFISSCSLHLLRPIPGLILILKTFNTCYLFIYSSFISSRIFKRSRNS